MNRIHRWFSWGRRSRDEEIARGLIAELLAIQSRLLKLESAWRQEVAAHAHAIAVAQSLEALAGRQTAQLGAMQPSLLKLESACGQQLAAHRHMIEIARSQDDEISRRVDTVFRRELDLSGPSALGSLWDHLNQLHAQVQGIAEALRTQVSSLETARD